MSMIIQRKKRTVVHVDNIVIGGDAPIVVQSMTNTDTVDVESTVKQILTLAEAGSELVRLTVDTEQAAQQISTIHEKLLQKNCSVPLVGDFHYNGHLLLTKYPDCAQA